MKKIREKMRQERDKFSEKKEHVKKAVKDLAVKTMITLGCVLSMCMGTVIKVNAEFQGMEKVATSLATQIMWVGFIIVAVVCIGMLAKRNFVQAGITFVVGGIVCYVVGHLNTLIAIGEWGAKYIGISGE